MAFILSGSTIRNPQQLTEKNDTQVAQNRTLSGSITRDYFGSNKRVWTLNFRNTKKADYDTIKAIYTTYLATATAVSWSATETNYTISATTVHMDLRERSFGVRGEDYISDFDLVLTEA
jgi:hypothetical protein